MPVARICSPVASMIRWRVRRPRSVILGSAMPRSYRCGLIGPTRAINWTMQSNEEVLQSLVPDTRLAGRTAVITGSTSGIGEAVARVLAASGAEVVVSGRDAD
ncbi:SDR family NAD(P)-dependent oxidoreductase, partial [Clavibacter michiganensis]|uniref:SDR family NAD(P)-dependent oxidoreductase n=1 Tax=Clavibacter michiganensis TaxID=28447 RepID=UPI003757875D